MKARNILQKSKLKVTRIRLRALNFFMSGNKVFSYKELKNEFCSEMDRVSLYRILHQFEDTGIIMKVLDTSGEVKYCFCEENSSQIEDFYFKCSTCNKEEILPALPGEYYQRLRLLHQIEQIHLHAEGICKECSHNQ